MICPACGAEIAQNVRFCSKCGAQAPMSPAPQAYPVYPPAAYISRVRRHLQTVGILWCVYGVYRVVRGVVAMFVLSAFTLHGFGGGDWPFWMHGGRPFGVPWMRDLLPVVAILTVVWAALALLTGYALLTRRPWGRVLAIVLAILSLIKIPFGTALGIYTLWVLAPGVSGMEYEEIADHS